MSLSLTHSGRRVRNPQSIALTKVAPVLDRWNPWAANLYPSEWARWVTGLAFLMVGLSPSHAHASPSQGDWPGFRGPNADGVSTGGEVFSSSERFGLKVVWKRPIGSGYSGIAIAEGHVVTMFSDETSDVLVAFDELTGKEQWRFKIGPTYKGHDGSHTGPISTPLIAGGRVFGLAPLGRLFALEAATGRLIWSTELVADHKSKKPHYGFSTSPILQDGVLVIQVGAEDAAVAGFAPATGKRLWAAGSDTVQYQSPASVVLNGRRQTVAAGDKKLFGINAGTGAILWQHAHGGGGPRGIASATPIPAGKNRLFLAFKDDASTVIDLGQSDVAEATTVWESRTIRNSYAVPVYDKGYLYAFSSRFLTCVDGSSGKRVWRSRQPGDGFLILVDGHLVIITKQGSLHVAKASPDGYREAAGLPMFDDLSWSMPSFANGHIYVRSHGEIARVEIQPGVAPAAAGPAPGESVASSRFGRFLARVQAASDKKAVVDGFMVGQARFPLIEGDDLIHFVYRGAATDLAIAGDLFGARQERPMIRVEGTDLFYYSMRLEPDTRVNYLYITDYEETTDPLNPRKTTTAIYGKEMEMSFSGATMDMSWVAMPAWKAPAHFDPPAEGKRGRIVTQELESKLLETKHSIEVYLPAGYDDTKRRYPVAYVHGGESAQKRGRMPVTLDNLIGRTVAPIIVVFVNYRPKDETGKYVEMFAEELIPYVDTHYRTIASAEARANIGVGFSGYSALMCTFRHPSLVGRVGCQSVFLWDSMERELKELIAGPGTQPLRIYLDWGKYEFRNPHEAWDLGQTNRRLADLLRGKGYSLAGGEVHDGTGWSSWRNRTHLVFETLFPAEPIGKEK